MRNANEEDSIDSAERRARAAAQVRRTRALAGRLRTLRAHRDVNQEQLSQAADVPRQIISGLEKGSRPRPEAETVARLARALGVTPRQLRGCDPIPELSAADAELAAEAVAGDAAALEREVAVTEPVARSAAGAPALGMTSLLTLPPGATVLQKYRPDGSVVLYVQIPATPPPPPPPPPTDGAPPDAV